LTNGLVAGTFFGFSAFVMRGLARLPADEGSAAMRSINVTAVGPGFMAAFIGGALFSLLLCILAFARRGEPGLGLAMAGGLLYLIGSFAVTVAFNVPLNDRLAQDSSTWTTYLTQWTLWNHVRTAASAASFAILAWSLAQQTQK
jgi:uncharacterized membrane protein